MPKVADLNALYPTDCNVQLRIRQLHLDWHYHIANGYIVYSKGGKVKLYEHRLVADAAYGQLSDGYHVHHIDETRSNNQASNLQVLEKSDHHRTHKPGVHATCQNCGKEFFATSKRLRRAPNGVFCSIECARKAQRKVERPGKEKLVELISNLNFCAVGRMYNVSDNTIRKWLKNYDIDPKRIQTSR